MTGFLAANAPLVVTLALIVLAIVVVGCALEGFRIWTVHREKMATALNAQAAEKAAQYAANGERLEARVQVLERIATDRGADLHHQIEQLRDTRAVN
ncbi:hypothetical protein [Sphingomonas rubra]|uniref:Phage shock protein B n=1 Tax=Sphingomonas rubra TaxID=634430 RepID=A0A1I5SXI4_9SPHN|nr:hypothetical protein [Sphingomonas rubra]SFP75361.1 hypothetical protein SAMN04488241_106218 [Sphingomonas rubra]